jgi:hypothetical protein
MKAAAFGLAIVFSLSWPVLAWAEDACDGDAEKQSKDDAEKKEDSDHSDQTRECRCRCKKRHSDVELSVTGIRPSITHVVTERRSTNDIGVAFAGAVDSYELKDTTHTSLAWVLGGGQAGFEGLLAGAIDFGYRANVTKETGPFGRIGFAGDMQGNNRLYYSALELPRFSLGWQFMSQKTVLELGARAGTILTGRFNPGDDGVRHTTGSWEYGGFASMQFDFIRAEANVARIDARKTGDGSPVDMGRAALCAIMGKVGICADYTAFHGTARFGGPTHFEDVVASYAGMTFGFASW